MKKLLKQIFLSVFLIAIVGVVGVNAVLNFYQSQNIDNILINNLDGRLIPHKANYPNKLNNIIDDGLRSFELDLVFTAKTNNNSYFEVGHDSTELNGIKLEDYLKKLNDVKIKKIWMDVKNLSQENIKQVLERLDYLDIKYGIKKIAIFENYYKDKSVKIISDKGYETSYSLPYGSIVEILASGEDAIIEQEAQKIKKQIEMQNLKAISFVDMQYPFVKKYVEPIITQDINYHIFNTIALKHKNSVEKIKSESYYNDERIKTIIYSYHNNKFNRLYNFDL